jgi:c-di-GMP-binding flagellar brake protein YcgR
MSLWPFRRNVASVARIEVEEPTTSLHEPDTITRPDAVAEVLEKMHAQRCHLSVSLADVEDSYSSLVLEVVRTESYFVLDELTPRAVNAHVTVGTELTIRARMQSATIRFTTVVNAVGDEDGLAYFRLPFPEKIDHLQRREYYRAGVPLEKTVPVQLAMPNGSTHSAELRDVSLGGFSARLSGGLPKDIAPGNNVQHLVITLPSSAKIHGSGEICYAAEPGATARVSRCGVRFLHIDRSDRHMLEQFIAQLDREMKRRHLR